MRRTLWLGGMGLLLALPGMGCESASDATSTNPAPVAAADLALCPEHGVLESVCTKCNPALIPVFKAKGDWCDAHGFPESFCPICNPGHGGLPAHSITEDEGPADGMLLTIATPEALRAAGFQTVPIEASEAPRELKTTAKLVYDAAHQAVINARSAGVVEQVLVDVGTAVEAGEPLVIIQSADIGAERSQLPVAQSRVKLAQQALARAESLYADGIIAESKVLGARQALLEAEAELATAQAALRVVGRRAQESGRFTLSAPISGVVLRRHVTRGQLVSPATPLLDIVDTSRLWAELDIPEHELLTIRTGQQVAIRTAEGAEPHRGTIGSISPEIDPRTRTVTARVPLENPEGILRAQMYVEARIEISRGQASLLVPSESVQHAKNVDVVFVRLAENRFEVRRVQRGRREGDRVEVTGALEAGEPVVTEGAFLLKTETLKESIGAGCAHDH